MPGQHMFSSKAQWRFAFARYGPDPAKWPRQWAERNKATRPFKTLPPRKNIRKKA